jgi:hypothetical protein
MRLEYRMGKIFLDSISKPFTKNAMEEVLYHESQQDDTKTNNNNIMACSEPKAASRRQELFSVYRNGQKTKTWMTIKPWSLGVQISRWVSISCLNTSTYSIPLLKFMQVRFMESRPGKKTRCIRIYVSSNSGPLTQRSCLAGPSCAAIEKFTGEMLMSKPWST